jgi:hypothetical protein
MSGKQNNDEATDPSGEKMSSKRHKCRPLLHQDVYTTACVAAAVPANAIKGMLLLEHDGVGTLLQPAVDLVGMASTLVLRNLIRAAAELAALQRSTSSSPSAGINDTTSGTGGPLRITVEHLRLALAEQEQFHCLTGALDKFNDEGVASGTSTILSNGIGGRKRRAASKQRPPSNRKRAKTKPLPSNIQSAQATILSMAGDQDSFAAAAPLQSKGIVPDEEEYD